MCVFFIGNQILADMSGYVRMCSLACHAGRCVVKASFCVVNKSTDGFVYRPTT
jgi:hypothetical protein